MTVKELMKELQKHDPDMKVEIFDGEWGYIDITDVFESERIYRAGIYTKLNIT